MVKVKIFPDENQTKLIEQTFLYYQYIYNTMLECRKKTKMNFSQSQRLLTEIKKKEPELKSVDSRALWYAIKDLDIDYQRFFQHRAGYPKPRTINNFYCTYNINNAIHISNLTIRIPKLGYVLTDEPIVIDHITKVGITRKDDGNYYIILTE